MTVIVGVIAPSGRCRRLRSQLMTLIAIAGLGVRGTHWRTAIESSPGVELSGIVEPDPDRVPGDLRQFGSIEEAIAARPDGLIVATPPETHFGIVEVALKAGVPVLCEKPLSDSFESARGMADLSGRTGVPLLVGMNFRYITASLGLRHLVDQGEYGDPLFAQFTYIRNRDGRRKDLNDYPLTMADPMLVDQSIHHLDLMRFAYGREVLRVSARTWNPATSVYEGDSCVTAILEFEGGLIVSYLGTWTSGTNRFDFRWRTDFAEGAVIQPGQWGGLRGSRRDPEVAFTAGLHDTTVEPPEDLGWGPSEPFVDDTAALLGHFVDVISHNDDPGPTAADHLRTLNLLDSIKLAGREGSVVDVMEQAESRGLSMES